MRLKVRSEVMVGQWIESIVGFCIDVGSFLNYLGDCGS